MNFSAMALGYSQPPTHTLNPYPANPFWCLIPSTGPQPCISITDLGLSFPRNCKLLVDDGRAPQALFSSGQLGLLCYALERSRHALQLLEDSGAHSFHTPLGEASVGPILPTTAFRDFLLWRKRRNLLIKCCYNLVLQMYLTVFVGLEP